MKYLEEHEIACVKIAQAAARAGGGNWRKYLWWFEYTLKKYLSRELP